MFRLAWLLTGDQSWAEELVADAFATTYAVWNRGGVQHDRAYLRQALTNRFRSGARRRALERRFNLQSARRRDLATDIADSVALTAAVHEALLALSPRQRAAVALFYFEDLPVAEVAAALGTSNGAVKTHLSRARSALRSVLADPATR